MRRAWRRFRGWPRWAQALVAFVVLIIVIAAASGGSGSKKDASASDNSPASAPVEETTTEAAPEPKANIRIVSGKSFCATTGIDDIYTGNGHVEFFLTFRNTGDADGSVDVIPVRHYDDGQMNESAMDMFSVDVAAGSVYKVHTDKMVYKAHEHEITDCGVMLGAGADEVPIKLVALG